MTHKALITGIGGREPKIDGEAFVAPTASVIGDVTLEAGASLWYGAVARGDVERISVGARSNIQDNCTLHADPGFPVTIGERVSVGHKTGDWEPQIGNDVGIVFAPSGPIVMAAFTNANTGPMWKLNGALGKVAEDVLNAWSRTR